MTLMNDSGIGFLGKPKLTKGIERTISRRQRVYLLITANLSLPGTVSTTALSRFNKPRCATLSSTK